jgi:hypothetical protein
MIKFLFGLLWGALLILGVTRFTSGNPKSEEWVYRGGQTLGKNYRFSDVDSPNIDGELDRKLYLGRYLLKPLQQSGSFGAKDLAAAPEIVVSQGRVPILLPLKTQAAAAALNAGMTVLIWKGSEQLGKDAQVISLLCPGLGAPSSDCKAVLAADKNTAAILAKDPGDIVVLPLQSR